MLRQNTFSRQVPRALLLRTHPHLRVQSVMTKKMFSSCGKRTSVARETLRGFVVPVCRGERVVTSSPTVITFPSCTLLCQLMYLLLLVFMHIVV